MLCAFRVLQNNVEVTYPSGAHNISPPPPVYGWVRVAKSIVFYVVFCILLWLFALLFNSWRFQFTFDLRVCMLLL